MRRVVCSAFAPLDQLTVEDAPDLVPAAGQVVVEVEAAGANFVDALLVQGLYQLKPALPFTPGMEVAGTVTSVGDGVDAVPRRQHVQDHAIDGCRCHGAGQLLGEVADDDVPVRGDGADEGLEVGARDGGEAGLSGPATL